jgi:hypothetical protein
LERKSNANVEVNIIRILDPGVEMRQVGVKRSGFYFSRPSLYGFSEYGEERRLR